MQAIPPTRLLWLLLTIISKLILRKIAARVTLVLKLFWVEIRPKIQLFAVSILEKFAS